MSRSSRDQRGQFNTMVRYDGRGRIIPGGNILKKGKKPQEGNWQAKEAYECCNYNILWDYEGILIPGLDARGPVIGWLTEFPVLGSFSAYPLGTTNLDSIEYMEGESRIELTQSLVIPREPLPNLFSKIEINGVVYNIEDAEEGDGFSGVVPNINTSPFTNGVGEEHVVKLKLK